MPTTLRADNFESPNIKELLMLAADSAPGASTVTFESVQNVSAADFVFLGSLGAEATEKAQVASTDPAAQTATFAAALSFAHRRFDRATVVRADQIRFYRQADANGTPPPDLGYTRLSSVDIDPDQLTTDYIDQTGGSDYWYKYTYYNSVSLLETPLADAAPVRGGDYGHYTTVDDIRAESGFRNAAYVTDQDIDMHRRRAESTINRHISKIASMPLSLPLPQGIEDMARVLAAGYLMVSEYGAQADNRQVAKNGQLRIDGVMEELRDLVSGNTTLLDASGSNIGTYASYGSSFPDEDTDPLFTIARIY